MEAGTVDDGADWFDEFVVVEFATGSVDGVMAGTLAAMEEFCAVSCDGGVADFLLRKRVAAPKSAPAIATIIAAVFQ